MRNIAESQADWGWQGLLGPSGATPAQMELHRALIHAASEDLQRHPTASGQPLPVFFHPHSTDVVPGVPREPPVFWFVLITSCPGHHWKKPAYIFLEPFLQKFTDIPPNLLFSRKNRPSSFSLSSWERYSIPFIILVALHWTLTSSSTSLLYQGAQNWDTIIQVSPVLSRVATLHILPTITCALQPLPCFADLREEAAPLCSSQIWWCGHSTFLESRLRDLPFPSFCLFLSALIGPITAAYAEHFTWFWEIRLPLQPFLPVRFDWSKSMVLNSVGGGTSRRMNRLLPLT